MFRTVLLVTAFSAGALPAVEQSQYPIQQILESFDRIGANDVGVISVAEFWTAEAVRWPQIYRNGYGFLSEDDFPHWVASHVRTQLAEIAHLDEHRNGQISKSEFLIKPAPVFRQADQIANGILTRSELGAAASG